MRHSSNIQNQIDNLSSPTITASRVAVGDSSSGNLVASNITTTELDFLDNVSSNIQNQLNGKLDDNSRVFNENNTEGLVRIRTNSSSSDNSSSEGTSLSQFIIRSKYHRNAGGTLINSRENNMFGVFCFSQSDSDGNTTRCDLRGGVFRSNDTEYLSDDRLKWDETPITGALDTLMKLNPQMYNKYTEYNVEDPSIRPTELGDGKKEFGLIAQEVAEISELSHLVGTDLNYLTPEMPIFALNYNGIFVLAVKAIQELKLEVETLKLQIAELTSS